jgi:hypothetical protein
LTRKISLNKNIVPGFWPPDGLPGINGEWAAIESSIPTGIDKTSLRGHDFLADIYKAMISGC